MSRRLTVIVALGTLWMLGVGRVQAANEGQEDLDKATEVKLSANTLSDLDEVIRLTQSALKKGLDEGNTQFANGLLASTFSQRGTARAALVLRTAPTDPRALPFRKAALEDLEQAVKLDPKQAQAWLFIAQLNRLPGGDVKRSDQAIEQAVKAAGDDPDAKAKALLLRANITTDEKQKLADLNEAVRLAPGDALAVRTRGAVLADTGKLPEALADLNKALELDPKNMLTLEAKALVLARMKKYDEALAALEEARQAAPDSIAPLLQKARIYAAQSNVKAAVRELEQARILEPNNIALLLLQATIEDDPAKKMAALDEAVRLAPGNTLALRSRGLLRAEQDKVDDALADFDKAIALLPKESANYEAKALVLAKLKRYDDALAVVDKLAATNPDLKSTPRFRAMLLSEAGRKDEARAALQKLVQADPKDLTARMQLALFYAVEKLSSQAIEQYSAVLAQDADNAAALRGRGDAYLNIGQHAAAVADYEKAMKLIPHDSGVLNNLAWVLATSPEAKLRDGKRAIKLATEACELTEYEAAHILSTLGAAYAETGDFANAKKWVKKGIEVGSDEEKKSLSKELESYEAGKPVRELLTEPPPGTEKKPAAEPKKPEAEKKPEAAKPKADQPPKSGEQPKDGPAKPAEAK